MDAKSFVEARSTIADNKVTIFSKSWCPYCKQTKDLFAREFQELEPKIVELDDESLDGDKIQEYLKEKSGQRTVPNVFISQKHIGGNDNVQAAFRSGRLAGLFSA
ncbi:glutaredoxin [Tricholoma matsutake]|nr:glutaredoxin [Tricholoma matsutake 945]